jgi:hypothetical protein
MPALLDTLNTTLAPTGGLVIVPDSANGMWCLVCCVRASESASDARLVGLHIRPDGAWSLAETRIEAPEATEMPKAQHPWNASPASRRWIEAWSRGALSMTAIASGEANTSWEEAARASTIHAEAVWPSGSPEAPYFLTELGMRAVYRETIDGVECGWGTTSIVGYTPSSEGGRVLVEQADSRGDRWKFNVLVTPDGVAAEIRGSCEDLVVQDWIWQFPIRPRQWEEQQGSHGARMDITSTLESVITEAGTFQDCLVMSARGEESAAQHWYHRHVGLVRSVFIDADGREGRRDLVELERLNLSCQL